MKHTVEFLYKVPESVTSEGLTISHKFAKNFIGNPPTTILIQTPNRDFQVQCRLTRKGRIHMFGSSQEEYMTTMHISPGCYIQFIKSGEYELRVVNFGVDGSQIGIHHNNLVNHIASYCLTVDNMSYYSVDGEIEGFYGSTWRNFYAYYNMEPGYHVVFSYTGTLFIASVFDRDGYLIEAPKTESFDSEASSNIYGAELQSCLQEPLPVEPPKQH
ncbi:OLC1v1035973C1 [Oldenlandia corymbosa var. corymbosa]|uniref:OLC1v1035973C1 n=1 Tax=Oldenlandia corymbosa var. corymbosa TaxID=529605 RepID=A0AAV1CWS6_OLDCO|nr:OLC1v1035973C1 [Oldenlandia corymbosa var. corymbosa]